MFEIQITRQQLYHISKIAQELYPNTHFADMLRWKHKVYMFEDDTSIVLKIRNEKVYEKTQALLEQLTT